jgi:hypothetical protein
MWNFTQFMKASLFLLHQIFLLETWSSVLITPQPSALYKTSNLCPRSFSSKTQLKAKSTRCLLQNWKNLHNIIGSSHRYPLFIESIPYNDSRALFRAFSGRTPSDPHYPYKPTPCKCRIETCTSAHLITSCRLLDHTRSIKLKNYLGAINPHTII